MICTGFVENTSYSHKLTSVKHITCYIKIVTSLTSPFPFFTHRLITGHTLQDQSHVQAKCTEAPAQSEYSLQPGSASNAVATVATKLEGAVITCLCVYYKALQGNKEIRHVLTLLTKVSAGQGTSAG